MYDTVGRGRVMGVSTAGAAMVGLGPTEASFRIHSLMKQGGGAILGCGPARSSQEVKTAKEREG